MVIKKLTSTDNSHFMAVLTSTSTIQRRRTTDRTQKRPEENPGNKQPFVGQAARKPSSRTRQLVLQHSDKLVSSERDKLPNLYARLVTQIGAHNWHTHLQKKDGDRYYTGGTWKIWQRSLRLLLLLRMFKITRTILSLSMVLNRGQGVYSTYYGEDFGSFTTEMFGTLR